MGVVVMELELISLKLHTIKSKGIKWRNEEMYFGRVKKVEVR